MVRARPTGRSANLAVGRLSHSLVLAHVETPGLGPVGHPGAARQPPGRPRATPDAFYNSRTPIHRNGCGRGGEEHPLAVLHAGETGQLPTLFRWPRGCTGDGGRRRSTMWCAFTTTPVTAPLRARRGSVVVIYTVASDRRSPRTTGGGPQFLEAASAENAAAGGSLTDGCAAP
jgi:hypothetical protein